MTMNKYVMPTFRYLLCVAFVLGLFCACSNSVLDINEEEQIEELPVSLEESSSSAQSFSTSKSKSEKSSSSKSKSSSSTKSRSSSSVQKISSSSSHVSSSSKGSSSSTNQSSSSTKSNSSSSEKKISSSSSHVSSSSNESSSSANQSSSSMTNAFYETLKANELEYPYADIPRIVIETENRQAIKDRETEIPAKLQIWGEKQPESEIMDLTIRGRGNSSWDMPKKSYKIEFLKKQSILGMPKDKDWALIANHYDKSLMRNFIAYRLSSALGAYYAPRCEFVELYLNGEYLGVYLLTETIKIGENRVNIPKDDNSYIVEVDGKYKANEQIVFSDVIIGQDKGKAFRVHAPKNATASVLDTIQNFIRKFERHLLTFDTGKENEIEEWIDVGESVKHYWVQEFTKNPDSEFYTSVYFSWVKGEGIKMGPVWDFDLAFGNHLNEMINSTEEWHLRKYWYFYLYRDLAYKKWIKECWIENKSIFEGVLDSIGVYKSFIEKAALNNFKRWNVLEDASIKLWKNKTFSSYDEVVSDLKNWISKRFQWIDEQLDN